MGSHLIDPEPFIQIEKLFGDLSWNKNFLSNLSVSKIQMLKQKKNKKESRATSTKR